MNRLLFPIAFLLGAAAVLWMASTFLGSDLLALTVTLVIGCVYTIGFIELANFRRATDTLTTALSHLAGNAVEDNGQLDEWLKRLHPSLQNSVRLRVAGDRVGLPAPVITPYLVGLLVMLGLLGTFVGMVDTLKGAVFALEGTTELQAIRAGLAAPINGLSLAFGTSVAGVAASAMLGLISTLSRRDRMLATGQLDAKIATIFRKFTLGHNRQETYKALQTQAQALPEVADKLQSLADKLERMGDSLSENLIGNQALFHEAMETRYSELAQSVDRSLKESLTQSGRMVGESIKPVIVDAMAEIQQQTEQTHSQLGQTAKSQLDTLSQGFKDALEEVTGALAKGLSAHEHSNQSMITGMGASFNTFSEQFDRVTASTLDSFDSRTSASVERQEARDQERLDQWTQSLEQVQEQAVGQLSQTTKIVVDELTRVADSQQTLFKNATQGIEALSGSITDRWLQTSDRIEELTATLSTSLNSLREDEASRGAAAIERLADLELAVAVHIADLGKTLELPMSRLIETASETPKAAAEVIGHLRQEISNNIERDNQLLEERSVIIQQLMGLSESLQESSADQRHAVEALVTSSAGVLADVGSQFNDQVDSELSRISGAVDNFSGSTSEMSSLGEMFGSAVTLFSESNEHLIEHLTRIEQSMDKSTAQSDQQMTYYVAQAREIIDQSMLSQKEVFEQLSRLKLRDDLIPAEAS